MFYLVCIFIFVFCKSLCFILSVFLYWFYLYDFLYFVCICIWIYICICIYMYIVCFCELVFLFLCICAGGCHSLPNWVNWVNSNFNYRRHYLCCQCILRPSLGAAIAGGGVGAGVSAKLSYVFIGVNALAFPYQIPWKICLAVVNIESGRVEQMQAADKSVGESPLTLKSQLSRVHRWENATESQRP